MLVKCLEHWGTVRAAAALGYHRYRRCWPAPEVGLTQVYWFSVAQLPSGKWGGWGGLGSEKTEGLRESEACPRLGIGSIPHSLNKVFHLLNGIDNTFPNNP